jgi:hypothetical protein
MFKRLARLLSRLGRFGRKKTKAIRLRVSFVSLSTLKRKLLFRKLRKRLKGHPQFAYYDRILRRAEKEDYRAVLEAWSGLRAHLPPSVGAGDFKTAITSLDALSELAMKVLDFPDENNKILDVIRQLRSVMDKQVSLDIGAPSTGMQQLVADQRRDAPAQPLSPTRVLDVGRRHEAEMTEKPGKGLILATKEAEVHLAPYGIKWSKTNPKTLALVVDLAKLQGFDTVSLSFSKDLPVDKQIAAYHAFKASGIKVRKDTPEIRQVAKMWKQYQEQKEVIRTRPEHERPAASSDIEELDHRLHM